MDVTCRSRRWAAREWTRKKTDSRMPRVSATGRLGALAFQTGSSQASDVFRSGANSEELVATRVPLEQQTCLASDVPILRSRFQIVSGSKEGGRFRTVYPRNRHCQRHTTSTTATTTTTTTDNNHTTTTNNNDNTHDISNHNHKTGPRACRPAHTRSAIVILISFINNTIIIIIIIVSNKHYSYVS